MAYSVSYCGAATCLLLELDRKPRFEAIRTVVDPIANINPGSELAYVFQLS